MASIGRALMSTNSKLIAVLCGSVSALALTTSSGQADAPLAAPLQPITSSCLGRQGAAATLTPPNGQPDFTQVDGLTQANVFCLTTVQVPGLRLNNIGGSWVDPVKALYFLGDKPNKAVDIINTANTVFKARLGAGHFVGNVLTNPTSINNNVSGPNGVRSCGNWVYAGDGNSTIKVFDLATVRNWPAVNPPVQTIATGGSSRANAINLSGDCSLLIVTND